MAAAEAIEVVAETHEVADLLHRYVQIQGLSTAPISEADLSYQTGPASLRRSTQQVQGSIGKALHFDSENQSFIVELADEGVLVDIPLANLVPHEVPAADQGGFDIMWPFDNEDLVSLGWEVANVIADRGWCLLQVPQREELRTRAVAKASTLNFTRQQVELQSDYLGRKGVGKATEIDPLKLTNIDVVVKRLEAGPPPDAMQRFDFDLSCLYGAVSEASHEILGFPLDGRTEAMVWMPFSGGRERSALEPEELDTDAIEEGVLQRHLHFLRRRKLCLLYLVHTEGGRLTLYSKGDGKSSEEIEIPACSGRLLAFRCDSMMFKYEPSGNHLTMLSWVLEAAPQLEFSTLEGDAKMKDELYGIMQGPGAPYHQCPRVLAVSCQTAGSANSIEEAMNMYLAGTDGNIYVPSARFDTDMYFTKDGDNDHISGRNSYQVHSGLVEDMLILSFDPGFFNINEDVATVMAPNQRKVLEVGYEALMLAGFNKKTLNGAPIMVAIGDCGTEWGTQIQWMRLTGEHYDGRPFKMDTPMEKLDLLSASTLASIGSRLSYNLGLTGPTFHVETACSSGLTAFCTSMYTMRTASTATSLNSRVQGAIAGGVNLCTDPGVYIGNCSQHMLSVKGRCFTFDATATGYARGEGTSLLYATFSDNQKDMDMQLGCAIGNKVNQDGRSASMTAPNGPSQQMCIRASMREAQIGPRDVTTSECHGTGTALGDPIEVGSIRGVTESDDRQTPLYCTSSKSNIGHLEANAGTTGLIKCILMGRYGNAPANVHLKLLNPHLDASGWPAYFEADIVDYAANSGIAGVSSFGVSGTNSHAEVWSKCVHGPNSAARFVIPGYMKLDQIKVTCPITMGPIDYLTGEPVVPKFGPQGETLKARADVLRDDLASYDVSSYVYKGSYRFRASELEDALGEIDESVFICGTWSGLQQMQQMQYDEDGQFYSYTIVLGETRCESFFLCLDKNISQRLYPATNAGAQHLWIYGPDSGGQNQRWMIDGRNEEIPAGTVYQIKFRWGVVRKTIEWERVDAKLASLAPKAQHSYSVMASWTTWRPQKMEKSSEEQGLWEVTIRIGPDGREEFQFLRDNDLQQVIYPAEHGSADVAARGPDDLGKGKNFVVRGRTDEQVRLTLHVEDGSVTVTAKSDLKGEVVWRSQEGSSRHEYCVVGSWTDYTAPEPMLAMESPGVFRYRGSVRNMWSDDLKAFVEFFRIIIDNDQAHGVYPEAMYAGNGDYMVHGPDGNGKGRMWAIRSRYPNTNFEITYDSTAVDRRRIVTWTWLDGPLSLEE
mmetsp:Transcript_11338/g.28538  ORF Transcript_11338/g.28538 Transcript_11338/m.28538 type:complete len:1282 (-) Transcript_11338:32-3877(-)